MFGSKRGIVTLFTVFVVIFVFSEVNCAKKTTQNNSRNPQGQQQLPTHSGPPRNGNSMRNGHNRPVEPVFPFAPMGGFGGDHEEDNHFADENTGNNQFRQGGGRPGGPELERHFNCQFETQSADCARECPRVLGYISSCLYEDIHDQEERTRSRNPQSLTHASQNRQSQQQRQQPQQHWDHPHNSMSEDANESNGHCVCRRVKTANNLQNMSGGNKRNSVEGGGGGGRSPGGGGGGYGGRSPGGGGGGYVDRSPASGGGTGGP